ncbi:MAG: hypothetical protein NW237_12460 [Cyanobacteriota bacterium]|nr:hypothetical protein [Cyanobacteriota bacterium]
MTTLQKLSDQLCELEARIPKLMKDGDPNPEQLAELESQAHWLKNKLKVYYSLRAAFDALPENGAGEAYGDLLDQMADVKAAITQRVIPSPTERVK